MGAGERVPPADHCVRLRVANHRQSAHHRERHRSASGGVLVPSARTRGRQRVLEQALHGLRRGPFEPFGRGASKGHQPCSGVGKRRARRGGPRHRFRPAIVPAFECAPAVLNPITCSARTRNGDGAHGDVAVSPISIVKAIGGPGSIGFLALSCSVGILLVYTWPKRSAIGRSWLLGTLLLYGVLAFPFVAHSLAESLPPVRATTLTSVGTLDELILLSGDNEDGRVAEAVDAWRTVKPDLILVL